VWNRICKITRCYVLAFVEIDEKGTLKATEHDQYENIAGLL
jgi:hypothetical protein